MPDVPSVTLNGVRTQVRPAEGNVVAEIVTVPIKPCIAGSEVTVIVEVPEAPALTVTVLWPRVTVKSWIV